MLVFPPAESRIPCHSHISRNAQKIRNAPTYQEHRLAIPVLRFSIQIVVVVAIKFGVSMGDAWVGHRVDWVEHDVACGFLFLGEYESLETRER